MTSRSASTRVARSLRCLLLAPMAPPDPDNGDAQFTRDLLACPPPQVEYVPYTQALATGEIVAGPSVKTMASEPWHLRDVVPAATRAGLHLLRRSGYLLPDPVRWVRLLAPFDLVHMHCMPVRFLGKVPPVVISDSAGTWWHWTAARGVPDRRVHRMLVRERQIARVVGYLHPSAHPDRSAQTLLFVDAGRRLLRSAGVRVDGVRRCPPGVPRPLRPGRGDGRTLAFVAHDFKVKGGDLAVAVLQRLRRTSPEVRLLVAGPREPDRGVDGVEWLGPMNREQLYERVYPQADVFLYPTRADCAPLVVMEALAHGVPVVAPSAFALPELVKDGITGRLFEPGDVEGAVAAVVDVLADRAGLEAMRRRCRRDFEERFSVDHRNRVLAEAYAEAVR
jgi:glycosyltransferase involved in cell wall biosynthesis